MQDIDASDVYDALSKLDIDIDRETPYDIWARCPNPDHDDPNPSWHISKDTGQHHCFGCGFGGSLYSLSRELSGQPLSKLLGWNSATSNSHRNNTKRSRNVPSSRQDNKPTEICIEGNEYSPFLFEHVKRQMRRLGITKRYAETFQITYVKYAFINGTDFVDRLLFKVYRGGKLVNVEGRDATGDQPKKVIYPRGSTSDTLWNYDNLKKDAPLVVCEGIKDTIKVWASYTQNVTSIFGASLTKKQKRMFYQFEDIILFPDNDQAGLRLVNQFNGVFELRNVRVAIPPHEGADPADLTLTEIRKTLDNAGDAVDYETHSLRDAHSDREDI